MFRNDTCLRHLLQPNHYTDPHQYRVEMEQLFLPSWQFACTRSEVSDDGDFVTFNLCGTPVIVRNFNGEIRAFKNICPHRHAMLRSEPSGNSPTLRCQYHGWEYGVEGRTGRIPEAKAFRPWDRENSCLTKLRLESCGDLLFITFAKPERLGSLADWMNPFYDELADAFSLPMWRMGEVWEFQCDCNWKIPTENTLESYHVAEVHPQWLGGKLPDELSTHHRLDSRYTTLDYSCESDLKNPQAKISRSLGGTPHQHYRHWHIHPNIAFCMTDTFNYLATCQPVSPTQCVIRSRMYPIVGYTKNPWRKLVRHVAWRIGRRAMRGIFNEDRSIFDAQQAGITASDHPGVIGTREERIHTFQQYVCQQTGIEVADDPAWTGGKHTPKVLPR